VYSSVEKEAHSWPGRGALHGGIQEAGALEALRERDTVRVIAIRHEIHPNQVSTWKRQAVEGLGEVFAGPSRKAALDHEKTLRDLHAKIGELTVERDFSARVGALSRSERVEMIERGGPLALARQCGLPCRSPVDFGEGTEQAGDPERIGPPLCAA